MEIIKNTRDSGDVDEVAAAFARARAEGPADDRKPMTLTQVDLLHIVLAAF